MPNHEVNLTKRIQTPQGSRYCPVVLSANGRVKPDFVHVNGKQEHHREGAYYIEWREGGRRKAFAAWPGRTIGRVTSKRSPKYMSGKNWRSCLARVMRRSGYGTSSF